MTRKISDTCFEVFHSGTRWQLIRNVQHLKLAEPVELIPNNTSVNILPGRSQLYVHDKHLPDLQWLFTKYKIQLSDLLMKWATQMANPCDDQILPQQTKKVRAKKYQKRNVSQPPQPELVVKQSTRGCTIVQRQDPDYVYTVKVCNLSHIKLLCQSDMHTYMHHMGVPSTPNGSSVAMRANPPTSMST